MSAGSNKNGPPANKKKPKQIDFIVNTGDPNDASSRANKKRVRSVAALKSWPERRKKIFEQLESSSAAGGSGGQSAFLVETNFVTTTTSRSTSFTAGPRPSNQMKRTSSRDTSSSTSTAGFVTEPPRPVPPPPPKEPTYIGLGAGSSIALYHDALSRVPATKDAVKLVHLVHPDTPCLCKQCRSKRRIANTPLGALPSSQYAVSEKRKRMADGSEKAMMGFGGDLAMLTPPTSPGPSPSKGKADPFNCYPVPYQPWFDHILHHSRWFSIPRDVLTLICFGVGWQMSRLRD